MSENPNQVTVKVPKFPLAIVQNINSEKYRIYDYRYKLLYPILQEMGQATNKVMSQKAISDLITLVDTGLRGDLSQLELDTQYLESQVGSYKNIVTQLQSTYEDDFSNVESAISTLSTGAGSIASRMDSLEATVGNNKTALISQIGNVQANLSAAKASWRSEISTMGSAITSVESTMTGLISSNSQAISTHISEFESAQGTNEAKFESILETFADERQAYTELKESLEAYADDASAFVITKASAGSTPTGMEALYEVLVKVKEDDASYSAGFGIGVDSSGNSKFYVDSDNFNISGNGGSTDVPPFLIDNTGVYLNGNIFIEGTSIKDGTITADQINTGAITADKVATGAITAGKINVTDLSAISANLGSLTVDTLNITSGAVTTVDSYSISVTTSLNTNSGNKANYILSMGDPDSITETGFFGHFMNWNDAPTGNEIRGTYNISIPDGYTAIIFAQMTTPLVVQRFGSGTIMNKIAGFFIRHNGGNFPIHSAILRGKLGGGHDSIDIVNTPLIPHLVHNTTGSSLTYPVQLCYINTQFDCRGSGTLEVSHILIKR